MDIEVKCPACGQEMIIAEGVESFKCVNCNEQLFYLKGKVITKTDAKLLLKKLIEKRQAEKKAQKEAEFDKEMQELREVNQPEPIMAPAEEEEIVKDSEKHIAPAPIPAPVQAPIQALANAAVQTAKPEPIVPANKVVDTEVNTGTKKAEKADKGAKSKDKVSNLYGKSGAGFALFVYILTTAIYGAWCFILADTYVFPNLENLINGAFPEYADYINLGLTIYFTFLVAMMWISASSSFMALGVVRKKASAKADLIASACTILNIPNIPLIAIMAHNRNKFKKFKRTENGSRFNFAPGYIAPIAIFEIIMIAINAHFLYFDVMQFLENYSSDLIPAIIELAEVAVIPFIVVVISLSRLIKIMVRGKKMSNPISKAL